MAVDPSAIPAPAPAPAPIVGELSTDLASNPNALLRGAGAVLAYLLLAFGFLLVAAVLGNHTAQQYVAAVFGATTLWAIVGVVLLGSAYLAPSPLKTALGGK